MRNSLKNAALVLGSLLFFFGLLEFVCRQFPAPNYSQWMDPHNFKANSIAESDPMLGYRLRKGIEASGFRYNSQGFVGAEFSVEKPADAFRIICLGGSTTLGTGTETDQFTYPALLQAIFEKTVKPGEKRIEVINGGVFGYHSWHTNLRILQCLDQYAPDMYLVMDGLNDLAAAKSMTLTQLEGIRKESGGPLSILAPKPSLLSKANDYFTHLAMYRQLRSLIMKVLPKPQIGYQNDKLKEKFSLFGYADNLERSYRHASSQGIQFILVEYPWKLSPYFPGEEKLLGIHPEHATFYRMGRELLQAANSDISKNLNLPLVDPQPAFDSRQSTSFAIRRLWADDLHFTRYGNYILAKEVYKALMEMPGFRQNTGIRASTQDKHLDVLFQNILSWRPADGQGWPAPSVPILSAHVISTENIKEGPKDEESGFRAWVPLDPSSPGRILFELPQEQEIEVAALYARISGGGDRIELRTGNECLFSLSNTTGDGLWSPLAGWYRFPLHREEKVELVLHGENAQVWHRGEGAFFVMPPWP